MGRKFTIIAHARSGSTLLCRKLGELTGGRVYLEIFHRDMKVIRNHLGEDAEAVLARFRPLEGDELREHLAAHPLELLAFLETLHPGRDLFFKVFPGHLAPAKLEEVFGGSAGVIVLQRNLLHSYISSRIARRIRKWTTVDTSDQRITFEPRDFVQHLRQTVGFYTAARALAAKCGVPCAEIDYEVLARNDPDEPALRAVLAALEIPAAPRPAAPDPKLRRQDRRTAARDKVDNPEETIRFLREIGLEQADDGLSPVPLEAFGAALERAGGAL